MPIHDFRCPDGHVHDALVKHGVKEQLCPACGKTAEQVFLKAPQLDWSNMAMGANAGPEFIDRFDRSRKQRREQEKAHKAEHGDNLRGAGS